MATVTTPAFMYNGTAAEAFVPTDSGATIRCPRDKYVVGAYYDEMLSAPDWVRVADVSGVDSNLIVYENMGELGNKLVFVPVPEADNSPGNAGDIAVVSDTVTGITGLYLCTVTGTEEDGLAEWSYFEPASWPV